MKKKLSVLLIFALVLALLLPAISLAATDVEGTKYENAVESLNALGVLKGYPDGTFKPNNTITRAEFAAVAIRLLGLEDAARVSSGVTKYSDMTGYEWASGYVNVASQKGIILGYPDGTFNPGKPVTQAEALTILVRVLGYEPIVDKEGWPTNYIIKATELGLTKGIQNVSAIQPATRGIVALFSANTLYIDKMIQTGYFNGEPTYGIDEGNTLLTTNLGAIEYTGLITDSYELVDSSLEEGQFRLETEDGLVTLSGNSTEGLYGRNITVWANNDNEVINVIVNDTVNEGIITAATDNDSPTLDTVLFKGKTVRTKVATDAKLTLNYAENSDITKYVNLRVKYTLNKNGQIGFIEAVNYTDTTPIIVDYIEDEEIFNKIGNSLDLEDEDYNIDLSELNEFDVIYDFSYDNKHHLDVFRKQATGKLYSVYANDDLRIGGAKLSVNEDDLAFSTDNGDSVNLNASANDFLGENVTAVLDANGEVLFLFANINVNYHSNYMAVADYDSETYLGDEKKYYIHAINQNNKLAWYQITEDTKFLKANGNEWLENQDGDNDSVAIYKDLDDIQKYFTGNAATELSFNLADVLLAEDGTVARIMQAPSVTYEDDELSATPTSDFIKSRYLVKLDDDTWTPVAPNAVFFDAAIAGEEKFVTWDSIASITKTIEANVAVDDGEVAYIYVTDVGITITDDNNEGVLVTAYDTPDGKLILSLNQEGIITGYEVSKIKYDNASELNKYVNDYVVLTILNGKVTNIAEKINSEDDGEVVKSVGSLSITTINNNIETINYLEADVLIYDITGEEPELVSLRNVSKGKEVLFYDSDDNGLVDVVLIVE